MTTTDIAVHQPPTTGIIRKTAGDLDDAYRIATALGQTSFVPQHFRGKPEDAMAAILYGQTIAMDPMTALQNLYVISGKPALYSRPMVGIVLAQGHEIWTEVDTPERVVVCGRRKGSEHIERSEWTIERARQAGYTNNKKYQSDPQAMLYARASGDVARKVAPDALLGMAYNVEELEASPDRAEPERENRQAPARQQTPEAPPAQRQILDDEAARSYIDTINACENIDDLNAVWTVIREGTDPGEHLQELVDAYQARGRLLEQASHGTAEPTLDDAAALVQETLDAELVEP